MRETVTVGRATQTTRRKTGALVWRIIELDVWVFPVSWNSSTVTECVGAMPS